MSDEDDKKPKFELLDFDKARKSVLDDEDDLEEGDFITDVCAAYAQSRFVLNQIEDYELRECSLSRLKEAFLYAIDPFVEIDIEVDSAFLEEED